MTPLCLAAVPAPAGGLYVCTLPSGHSQRRCRNVPTGATWLAGGADLRVPYRHRPGTAAARLTRRLADQLERLTGPGRCSDCPDPSCGRYCPPT